tara:strand:- start:45 stop:1031 length:987 start_codon:yes stop_codon:yes gene_type:complete
MIITRTPFRISFFGGGTDYPKYYRKYGGAVLGTTINKYCYVSCRKTEKVFNYKYRIVWSKNEILNQINNSKNPIVRATLKKIKPNSNIEIHFQADLPKNTGIGSSSAFCVGLIKSIYALKKKKINKKQLAKLAIEIEQNKLKEYCGSQDQVWSAYGGMNFITFKKNGSIKVNKLKITKIRKKNLEKNLILMFTGIQRYSKLIEKKKQKNLNKKIKFLQEIKNLTTKSKKILEGKINLDKFGLALNEYWELKKKLSENVSDIYLDTIYKKLIKNGAIGAKIIGSGGGGFFLIYCKEKKQSNLINKMRNYKFVKFKFENEGSKVIYDSLY